ncbi:unnamed protein product (mitochondrion) [Plasmodiophora brassicae]|uniref:Exocyst complex subunit EXOC6/Sec15 C-terminal domain-containing protein n=2 Tax=Plasmodiophora brassicae TaxID=37360 RepID=A0A3P3YKR9_PLABS|nr:unnamed protein product [Plasmodiophora brassicae]
MVASCGHGREARRRRSTVAMMSGHAQAVCTSLAQTSTGWMTAIRWVAEGAAQRDALLAAIASDRRRYAARIEDVCAQYRPDDLCVLRDAVSETRSVRATLLEINAGVQASGDELAARATRLRDLHRARHNITLARGVLQRYEDALNGLVHAETCMSDREWDLAVAALESVDALPGNRNAMVQTMLDRRDDLANAICHSSMLEYGEWLDGTVASAPRIGRDIMSDSFSVNSVFARQDAQNAICTDAYRKCKVAHAALGRSKRFLARHHTNRQEQLVQLLRPVVIGSDEFCLAIQNCLGFFIIESALVEVDPDLGNRRWQLLDSALSFIKIGLQFALSPSRDIDSLLSAVNAVSRFSTRLEALTSWPAQDLTNALVSHTARILSAVDAHFEQSAVKASRIPMSFECQAPSAPAVAFHDAIIDAVSLWGSFCDAVPSLKHQVVQRVDWYYVRAQRLLVQSWRESLSVPTCAIEMISCIVDARFFLDQSQTVGARLSDITGTPHCNSTCILVDGVASLDRLLQGHADAVRNSVRARVDILMRSWAKGLDWNAAKDDENVSPEMLALTTWLEQISLLIPGGCDAMRHLIFDDASECVSTVMLDSLDSAELFTLSGLSKIDVDLRHVELFVIRSSGVFGIETRFTKLRQALNYLLAFKPNYDLRTLTLWSCQELKSLRTRMPQFRRLNFPRLRRRKDAYRSA